MKLIQIAITVLFLIFYLDCLGQGWGTDTIWLQDGSLVVGQYKLATNNKVRMLPNEGTEFADVLRTRVERADFGPDTVWYTEVNSEIVRVGWMLEANNKNIKFHPIGWEGPEYIPLEWVQRASFDYVTFEEAIAAFDAAHSKNPQPFWIIGVATESNSADGIDVLVSVRLRPYHKVIKYIAFEFTPYNRVGDPITIDYKHNGQVTGPYDLTELQESQRNTYWSWETLWYDSSSPTSCARIKRITVTYMDGSKYTYINELPKLYAPKELDGGFYNDCSYSAQKK